MATKSDGKRGMSTRIDNDLYNKVKATSKGRQTSITAVVEEALEQYFTWPAPNTPPPETVSSAPPAVEKELLASLEGVPLVALPSFEEAEKVLEEECKECNRARSRFNGHDRDIFYHVQIGDTVRCITGEPPHRTDCDFTEAQLHYWLARRAHRGR